MTAHTIDKAALLAAIAEAGVIATLRAPDVATALTASETLLENGIAAIEVTYTTPDAGAVIAELHARHGADILLGAGTLRTAAQVEEAAAAGARFMVSPGFDPEVFRAARDSGALTAMGAFTATEVHNVLAAGADVVKYFPGSIAGPAGLRALRAPFPELVAIPTGGVSAGNLADWLRAGAVAVGVGGELLPAQAVREGDREAIARLAGEFTRALAAYRAAAG